MATKFGLQIVKHVAGLAKLKLTKDEEKLYARQFDETLEVVSKLDKLDTEKTAETSQVTGLTNVYRQDKIDASRILSQEEALLNAKKIHNGYFVVDAVLDEK